MDYADQMLPFKLLFREINMVEFTNEDSNFIKSRLKDYAFTSFRSCNYNSETNSTKMNNQSWIILEIVKKVVIRNSIGLLC